MNIMNYIKKCISADTPEYTYELCGYEKVTQKSKKGGGDTSLGNWNNDYENWKGVYSHKQFSGGQKCWGGPDRSATVQVYCSNENRLEDPQEPNKCEYTLKLYTPAACLTKELQMLETKLGITNF